MNVKSLSHPIPVILAIISHWYVHCTGFPLKITKNKEKSHSQSSRFKQMVKYEITYTLHSHKTNSQFITIFIFGIPEFILICNVLFNFEMIHLKLFFTVQAYQKQLTCIIQFVLNVLIRFNIIIVIDERRCLIAFAFGICQICVWHCSSKNGRNWIYRFSYLLSRMCLNFD